jgi:hypothetical protein
MAISLVARLIWLKCSHLLALQVAYMGRLALWRADSLYQLSYKEQSECIGQLS